METARQKCRRKEVAGGHARTASEKKKHRQDAEMTYYNEQFRIPGSFPVIRSRTVACSKPEGLDSIPEDDAAEVDKESTS